MIASRAGMSGFEQKEETRPDFEGTPTGHRAPADSDQALFLIGFAPWLGDAGVSRPSLVSDEEVLDIKDKREKNIKASASASVISLFIGLVIAAVVAIFVLRFTRASQPHSSTRALMKPGEAYYNMRNGISWDIMRSSGLSPASVPAVVCCVDSSEPHQGLGACWLVYRLLPQRRANPGTAPTHMTSRRPHI